MVIFRKNTKLQNSVSNWDNLSPNPQGGFWQYRKTFLIVTTGWSVLLADTEQSTMHRAGIAIINDLIQNINSAQVEKLRSRIACISASSDIQIFPDEKACL